MGAGPGELYSCYALRVPIDVLPANHLQPSLKMRFTRQFWKAETTRVAVPLCKSCNMPAASGYQKLRQILQQAGQHGLKYGLHLGEFAVLRLANQ